MTSIIGKIKDLEDEKCSRTWSGGQRGKRSKLILNRAAKILRELNKMSEEFKAKAEAAGKQEISLLKFLQLEKEYKKRHYKLNRELEALGASSAVRTVVFTENEFAVLQGLIRAVMSEHFKAEDNRGFITVDEQILQLNVPEYEAFLGAMKKLELGGDEEEEDTVSVTEFVAEDGWEKDIYADKDAE